METPAQETQPLPPSPEPREAPFPWVPLVAVGVYWTACAVARAVGVSVFSSFMTQLGAGLLMTLVFLGWWSFRRRVSRGERLVGLVAAAALGVLSALLSPEKSGGFAWLLTSLPWVFTVWALWLVAARRLSGAARRPSLVLCLGLAWGFFAVVRFEGLTGAGRPVMRWRWTPTSEERYLEAREREPASRAPAPAVERLEAVPGEDWPGFRGAERGAEVRGRWEWGWDVRPPQLVWRRPIGPGWSSLALLGSRLFTQEQRGDEEAVVCLGADSGEELWAHLERARFEDEQGGAGPRATPTLAGGRLFALGATGRLACLDPRTGEPLWTRDVAADSGAKPPIWGFTSSPLVVGERVVVFAAGDAERSLRAYDAARGEPAWSAPGGSDSYSSPQLFEVAERRQLLFAGDNGLNAVDPESGELLWRFAPETRTVLPPCLQAHALGPGRFVVAGDGGAAAFEVRLEGASWRATPLWSSRAFKPSFDDFVAHEGNLYGFDAGIFCCVDAGTGERRWKDGRYGYGQVLLVADSGVLLVVGESGEVVALAADPGGHRELGRFQALAGKTWNHPVLARGRLYLRNGEEAACYELEPAPR